MTNPDNVGGQMERFAAASIEAGYGDPAKGLNGDAFLYQRDADRFAGFQMAELCIADARRTSSYWKAELVEANKEIDRLRELCRAAPAGAETGNPVSEQNQQDSAPAGGDECSAIHVGHSMGPHGPDGELQCKYCGESAPAGSGELGPQLELSELYEAASRGFHISETCGPDRKYWFVSKFQTMAELHAFGDAWRKAMISVRDAASQGQEGGTNGNR